MNNYDYYMSEEEYKQHLIDQDVHSLSALCGAIQEYCANDGSSLMVHHSKELQRVGKILEKLGNSFGG